MSLPHPCLHRRPPPLPEKQPRGSAVETQNQYSVTINTAVAHASQFDESSFIQFYSIIWKWGFELLELQGWQTLTFQDENHSPKMAVHKTLAHVLSATTLKYRNK
jgi:hypothetical protein